MKTVLYHCILEEEIHFICSIPLYWNLSSVFIREIRGVILFGKSVDFYQQDSEVKKKKEILMAYQFGCLFIISHIQICRTITVSTLGIYYKLYFCLNSTTITVMLRIKVSAGILWTSHKGLNLCLPVTDKEQSLKYSGMLKLIFYFNLMYYKLIYCLKLGILLDIFQKLNISLVRWDRFS